MIRTTAEGQPPTPLVPEPRFKLSERSRANLRLVHPDLVRVVERALKLTKRDFVVIEGARDPARQRQLKAAGKSWTLASRHIPSSNPSGMAEAVDCAALVQGKISWDPQHYDHINDAFQTAAAELGIPVTWGGTWKQRDLVHFELTGRGLHTVTASQKPTTFTKTATKKRTPQEDTEMKLNFLRSLPQIVQAMNLAKDVTAAYVSGKSIPTIFQQHGHDATTILMALADDLWPELRPADKPAAGAARLDPDWVRRVQHALNRNGAGLNPDGLYGPATKQAVSAFQAARGLPVDGWCGPVTLAVLIPPAPAPKV